MSTTIAVSDVKAFPEWPHFDDEEVMAAQTVLRSGRVNYWTGTQVRSFEEEYAAYAQTKYAVAVANGTVSLELALRVLGVQPGDDVVTSPRTFIASASCAVAIGARPRFADVDVDSQNITAESIERVLTKRTKAILLVHLAGWPCDMDEILELARTKGMAVIEDCAQAHGAMYKGRPVGGIGDVGSFSFCQDKILTTGGEGGLLTLNDEAMWSRAWAYKDHGKSFDAVYRRKHGPGFRWLHESFGTNWRLTEFQAAIGRIQLRKLPDWVQRRRANAQQLGDELGRIGGLRIPIPPDHVKHSYYKFYAFIEPTSLGAGWSRDRIVSEINEMGVPCFSGSCSEIYLERAFDNSESKPPERLPNARRLGESSLMFLVHPTLGPDHIGRACEVAKRVIGAALK